MRSWLSDLTSAWRSSWRQQLPVAGAVLLTSTTCVAAYAWGAVSVSWPAQAFDAVFHLNAVAAVREGGNASLFGGLQSLYQGNEVYYPTPWHALVALLPGEVTVAANAALLATGAVLWPCALAGMLMGVRDLLPGQDLQRRWAVGLTVLLGGSAVSFSVLLTSLTAWPYALSVLALPGVLLLVHRLVRCLGEEEEGGGRRDLVATACLLALCVAGAACAHGTGVFNVLLLGAAWAPALLQVVTVRLSRRGRRLLGVAVLVVVVVGLWVMRRPLLGVLGYPRAGNSWVGLFTSVGLALADQPTYGSVWGWTALLGLVTGALTLLGAWTARHQEEGRRWLAAWLLALALTAVVGGPAWWGRQIGSLWYLQKARLVPLVLLPALVLVATACSRLLARACVRRPGRSYLTRPAALVIVAALVVVLGCGRLPLQRDLVASVHDPGRIQYGTLVSAREIVFMRQTASLLPPDALVIGAPSRGTSLMWALHGVHVVYPTRSWALRGSAERDLVETWPLLTDPEADSTAAMQKVCGLLKEIGAHYVYTDSSADAEGARNGQPPLRWDAALAQVPSEAVDLVASDGDYALWRFSACERGAS